MQGDQAHQPAPLVCQGGCVLLSVQSSSSELQTDGLETYISGTDNKLLEP